MNYSHVLTEKLFFEIFFKWFHLYNRFYLGQAIAVDGLGLNPILRNYLGF